MKLSFELASLSPALAYAVELSGGPAEVIREAADFVAGAWYEDFLEGGDCVSVDFDSGVITYVFGDEDVDDFNESGPTPLGDPAYVPTRVGFLCAVLNSVAFEYERFFAEVI
jgi:hypothetical protein